MRRRPERARQLPQLDHRRLGAGRLFDHVPAPAVPSCNADGTLAGKATFPLGGEYLAHPDRSYLKADDTISGTTRPWGMGPRVPMYVISPWSRGGGVDSQVFDHTAVAMFLEKRSSHPPRAPPDAAGRQQMSCCRPAGSTTYRRVAAAGRDLSAGPGQGGSRRGGVHVGARAG
ncbi:alkaline phosphatase family protein, partial [Actinoplanes sp. NPDC026619]|uniref:alkaline phosphatase family protein n=1 Tax=Actinoplanes sp. NPDC026619 TaxID=3155798 RepID=UPI0033D74DDD